MKSISIWRLNAILIFILLFSVILFFGKAFLIPLFFAILAAMLLVPICNKLESWGMGRVGSTFVGILIILLFVGIVLGIITAQGASLSEDFPKMQEKVHQFIASTKHWIETQYGISSQEQESYAKKGIKKVSESGGSFFSSLLSGIMGLMSSFVLVLLYFFFLMWKREKYHEFILRLVNDDNRAQVSKELDEINRVAGHYLIGRLVSMGFLAAIYMIGFSIVGVPNALLIALVAVLPTIVPYVGAFVGAFFPLAMALVGDSPDIVLPIVVILVIAQIIDNNIIEPLVEGESMDISPIFTIIAIVLGQIFWGVAGMILFIPMFAILKIVCDHIPSLHPYSFLLENEVEKPKWMEKVMGWFGTKKK